ncbi:MAG: FKBP-type peptidyl-prolyl cis-trans isomerase [Pseudomonadota bacterium]
MKIQLLLIAAATLTLGSLSACGAGGDNPPPIFAETPATLTKTDSALGTGALAATGKAVKVHYTGWLYTTKVATNKGSQFDTSVGKTPFGFTLGANSVIAGFDQGVVGMKVGGKRTVVIPASLAYGAQSRPGIPANSGLVFDIELLEVL